VLKAGACYIHLDIESLTAERVRQTTRCVNPAFVVISTRHVEAGHCVSDFNHLLGSRNKVAHDVLVVIRTRPEDPAYIIFPSGTISTPKGIVISRRALAHDVRQGQPDTPFNMSVIGCGSIVGLRNP